VVVTRLTFDRRSVTDMADTTVPPEQVLSQAAAMDAAVEAPTTTTALTDLDRVLNLNAAAIGLGLEDITYDPDRLPGLIYQSDDPEAVAIIFGNGTVLVESATPAGARDVVADIAGRLADLGLLDDATLTTDYETSPTAVPVPPEFEVESASGQTAVYPDGEATGDEQTAGDDTDTKVYRAAESESAGSDAGQSDPGGEGFARAPNSVTADSEVPDERAELYCPNCGLARTKDAATLRPGDICPECKQGYIAERGT
jgi:predicted RNA-binding Zn-ribbon protein involved in translation (DUF1610 family)